MRLLTRYLAREIYFSVAVMLFALLMLYFFMNLIEELADLGRGNYHLGYALLFITLLIPNHIYELLPLAALLGGIFALVQMASHSELVIYRCSGATLQQMVWALLKIGFPLVLLVLLFGEVIAPQCEHLAQRIRLKAQDAHITLREFRSGVWAKDEQSFVNVRNVLPDASLLNVSIYEFDETHNLKAVTSAERAMIQEEGRWQLQGVRRTEFSGLTAVARNIPTLEWHSALSPNIFSVLLTLPEKMSAYDLYQYTRHLAENHQKTGRYEIAMWNKIVYPLAVWIMLLLALPFASLQQRQGGMGSKIFTGIVIGLAYHFIGRLFASLGALNDWSPFLSATSVSGLFVAATLALLWKMERR